MSEPNNNQITVFAKTNFRNQERVFGIKADDRRRHMYIIGKTGMGKTNLLENLAIQDIQQGHGICFIDPHGDVALKLIKAIPPERINDVIYFDPADQQFPIAFNILEQVGPDQRSLVASGLVGVFKKIWADSWGPRLEYILRNAILALLEYPGSTLLGVMRILVDKSYRERVISKVTDPVVKSFWRDEFAGWNERTLQEVISPIQNKVGQFTSNSLIRNIIGQTSSAFNVRQIMDEQKILIMNLSKGKIGEDSSALLGAMMITKIQLAAMGRVDMAEEDRKDFYLYVDEFQNFATDSFANILSEARKYRLSLVLANQYITQLEEKVRDAIFGNAGTLISFRVGATDAEFLEKEFEPVFMMNDIVNLPKYQIYLKLMIDGIAGDAFSATTLPPILIETPGVDQKVIGVSRERYAASQEEVEEKIRRWTGMLSPEELAQQQGARKPVEIRRTSIEPRRSEVRVQTKPKQEERVMPKRETPALPRKEEVISKVKPVTEIQEQPKQEKEKPIFRAKPVQVLPPVKKAEETVPLVEEIMSEVLPEKVLYPAVCATCGVDIEVPFEPDGSRPTFCKDCLRDYQRAVAKSRNVEDAPKAERVRNGGRGEEGNQIQKKSQYNSRGNSDRKRASEIRAYTPTEQPMKLSQAQYIEPKKFKGLRKKPDINVSAIRALIDGARQSKEEN